MSRDAVSTRPFTGPSQLSWSTAFTSPLLLKPLKRPFLCLFEDLTPFRAFKRPFWGRFLIPFKVLRCCGPVGGLELLDEGFDLRELEDELAASQAQADVLYQVVQHAALVRLEGS